jgi:hypothetical protein
VITTTLPRKASRLIELPSRSVPEKAGACEPILRLFWAKVVTVGVTKRRANKNKRYIMMVISNGVGMSGIKGNPFKETDKPWHIPYLPGPGTCGSREKT